MSDQRKLAALGEPDVDLDGVGDPRIDTAEMGSDAARLGADRTRLETDSQDYLPPLPAKNLPRPHRHEDSETSTLDDESERSGSMGFVRRFSAVILILMTGSLAGFVTGVTGGILLFTGVLDLDSAWIKGVVDMFRGF